MKWTIVIFAVLAILVSPAFAQVTGFKNPSFELTQNDSSNGRLNPDNLTIPQYWYIGNGFTDLLGVADETNWTTALGFVNSTAGFGGGYAMQLGDDVTGSRQSDLMQANITVNTSLPVNITFFVNMADADPLLNGYGAPGQGFWTYILNVNEEFQIGLNKTGSFYVNIGVFDSTSAQNMGSGWWKVNLVFNVTAPVNEIYFEVPDYDLAQNYYPISNVTIYNPSPLAPPQPPIPPITGKVTGAAAGIISFLPLLIGVGIIVMVARKIEDMNSTEDFIAVIIGTGLAIVFLGVFAAIIAGLI